MGPVGRLQLDRSKVGRGLASKKPVVFGIHLSTQLSQGALRDFKAGSGSRGQESPHHQERNCSLLPSSEPSHQCWHNLGARHRKLREAVAVLNMVGHCVQPGLTYSFEWIPESHN